MKSNSVYQKIYDMVRLIPHGKVATYGQIAKLVDQCTPRTVGYAMAALPEGSDVPWHRVINSQGKISTRSGTDGELLQKVLLEAEAIYFDKSNKVDLKRFGWKGPQIDK